MAWPPANSVNGLALRPGLGPPTTLAWGTDGLYVGVVVISGEFNLMAEAVKIENGSGLTAALVGLNDGEEVILTVIDDRSIAFPDSFMATAGNSGNSNATTNTVSLVDPRGSTGTSPGSQTYIVIDNNYAAARKVEGQRKLLVRKYTLVS